MNDKRLIVESGLPGSGKSTLAEDIAQKLESPVFSVDPIESAIIKSGIEKSSETGLAAYIVVETLAAEQLKLGMSVVVDAESSVTEARDMWHKLSQNHSARLIIIECILDTALHKERLEARVRNMHGFSEITWNEVEQQRKEFVPWQEERLVIDTAMQQNTNLKKALEYISEH